MCFSIVTDTSANLPAVFLRTHQVTAIPFSYSIGERKYLVPNSEEFDSNGFFLYHVVAQCWKGAIG